MKKEILKFGDARAEASYYSHVCKVGDLLFVAGQTAANPGTGKVVKDLSDLPPEDAKLLSSGDMHVDARDGAIMAQTWSIYQNFKRILEANGSSLNDIVKTNIYMRNLRKDFSAFSRVRKMFIKKDPPASTVIETPALGPTDDVLIEIECIAVVSGK